MQSVVSSVWHGAGRLPRASPNGVFFSKTWQDCLSLVTESPRTPHENLQNGRVEMSFGYLRVRTKK